MCDDSHETGTSPAGGDRGCFGVPGHLRIWVRDRRTGVLTGMLNKLRRRAAPRTVFRLPPIEEDEALFAILGHPYQRTVPRRLTVAFRDGRVETFDLPALFQLTETA